jgi:hypothetical protein
MMERPNDQSDELDGLLARHGFGKVSCFGAYDPDVAIGATDRLVVVAQRVGDVLTSAGTAAAGTVMKRRG